MDQPGHWCGPLGVSLTVGGDDTRQRGDDHRDTEVGLELPQGRARHHVGPRVASLIVVEANAIGGAEQLVGTVVEALRPEGRVGDRRQRRRVLEDDHGGTVGKDDPNEEGDHSRDDDGQQVGQLGVDRQASTGGDLDVRDVDLRVLHRLGCSGGSGRHRGRATPEYVGGAPSLSVSRRRNACWLGIS